jgi:hypothetical protein
MDRQKYTVMRNSMQHIYHMWLTTDTQTFSSSLHTVTLHVTVFNLMGTTKLSKQHLLRPHSTVTPKHHTTHCLNADAMVQTCTTVNTTMLHT